jgi:hypothetical protein
MKFLVILILVTCGVFFQSAFAYHVEQERMEISQMSGIFNSEMEMIRFPLVGEEYHLQVVLRDKSQYENSTVTIGYGFNLVLKNHSWDLRAHIQLLAKEILKLSKPVNTNFQLLQILQ